MHSFLCLDLGSQLIYAQHMVVDESNTFLMCIFMPPQGRHVVIALFVCLSVHLSVHPNLYLNIYMYDLNETFTRVIVIKSS